LKRNLYEKLSSSAQPVQSEIGEKYKVKRNGERPYEVAKNMKLSIRRAQGRMSTSFFFLRSNAKVQLRSLYFKILAATFNRNFYEWIWYGRA
jgi:hypothetical protein